MAAQIYRLVMRSGPTPQRVFDITQPIINIGRDYSNDLVINDVEVSRRHARLTAQGGSYLVEDLGSTNGTFINGQRLIGPHMMRPGELISFGETVSLVYEAFQFDPNATVIAPVDIPPYQSAPPPSYGSSSAAQAGGEAYVSAGNAPAPQAYRAQASVPPASYQAPVYSGQIPESPAEEIMEEPKKGSRTLILLGLGCLVVFLCVCLGVAFAFDSLNLYCIPPFGSWFGWLYTCP